jgi:protein-disulfide isomerase
MRFRLFALFALLAGCSPAPADGQRPQSDSPPAAAPGQDPDLLRARSKGSPTAPVRVVEMSDFQCPFCRQFATETFPTIEREYIATGKAQWIFLNLPITEIHPNAVAAAEAAMCSARLGKFWPMHDLIFAHQRRWATLRDPGQFLLTFADSLQIPRDSIVPCLSSGATRDLIQRDANAAVGIGANSTPTFLVEGMLMSGAYPVEVFRQVLDSIHRVKTAR